LENSCSNKSTQPILAPGPVPTGFSYVLREEIAGLIEVGSKNGIRVVVLCPQAMQRVGVPSELLSVLGNGRVVGADCKAARQLASFVAA